DAAPTVPPFMVTVLLLASPARAQPPAAEILMVPFSSVTSLPEALPVVLTPPARRTAMAVVVPSNVTVSPSALPVVAHLPTKSSPAAPVAQGVLDEVSLYHEPTLLAAVAGSASNVAPSKAAGRAMARAVPAMRWPVAG